MIYKRKLRSIIVLGLITLLMVIPPINAFGVEEEVTKEEPVNENLEFIKKIMDFVDKNYPGEITEEQLLEGALKGMLSVVDEHSNYYNKEEYQDLFESVSGDFVGIGVYITEKDGYISVISPIVGTPAYEAGIKSGDRIISVDDTNIKGVTIDEASVLIKGEKGTNVKIGIAREGHSDTIYYNIIRDTIEINPVTYEIKKGNIGYIKITQFNSNTYDNVLKVLNEFDSKSVKKVIVDLRDNPGGYLNEVLKVLNLFVPKGPLVHIKYGDDRVETYNSELEEAKYEVVTLVNGASASASEIFAGAIKDSGTGIVIGTQTFGKGTVQNIIPIFRNDGVSGMKMTVAEYFTPNMTSINGIGIKPDLKVENETSKPKVDISDIPSFSKKDKPKLNAVGLDVLAGEKILDILGYSVNKPDGVLDGTTFNAIKKFQSDNKLYSYGVLDYTTQDKLILELEKYINMPPADNQLKTALDMFSN